MATFLTYVVCLLSNISRREQEREALLFPPLERWISSFQTKF